MTVPEFLAAEDKHFVALEYYMVMLNRTFLILLTDNTLIALKVNGAIAVEGGRDGLTRAITSTMAVKGDLQNPYSYIKSSYAAKYENLDLESPAIFTIDKTNFEIPYQEIKSVTFDKSKKWGMGNYPHTGKVFVTTKSGNKRELIILGNQSGEIICQNIMKAAGL